MVHLRCCPECIARLLAYWKRGQTTQDYNEGKDLLKVVGITKRRLIFANAVIGVLILGSLFALIFNEEYYPFSPYPMYSSMYDEHTTSEIILYGVTQEEPHREIPLRDSTYTQPFFPFSLEATFTEMSFKKDPERRQRQGDRALRDYLERYEELRLAGRHDGPPLQRVRLYEVRWQLDEPEKQKLIQPDHRKLIAEVEQRPR